MPENHSNKPNLIAVFATLMLCFGFILFVLVYDDLRREQIFQRITVLVLTLAIAVILFSVVPGKAVVKGAITISGAAAFFYLILPVIMKEMFPPSVSITGNIYHQTSDLPSEPLHPVEGVVVYIRDLNRQSQPTDKTGRFVIDNLPYKPKELMVSYDGEEYPIDPDQYPDGKYTVIPPEKQTSKSDTKYIPIGDWEELPADNCPSTSRPGQQTYPQIKQFRLEKEISKEAGSSNLYVHIRIKGEQSELEQKPDIFDAQKFQPPPGTGAEQGVNSERLKVRQWRVPASSDKIKVVFGICLGAKKGMPAPSVHDLEASYWFEKEE